MLGRRRDLRLELLPELAERPPRPQWSPAGRSSEQPRPGQQVVDGRGSGRDRSARRRRGHRRHHRRDAPPCARRGRRRAQARGRARWRARNQSAVQSPRPRTDGDARLDLLVRKRGERVEVEIGPREPDDVLGLPPREAERDELVLRRSAPSRSRVGNAYACSPRVPYRSIIRLRIANAAKSETCCAVIEVTRLSNGSGASGGRKPCELRDQVDDRSDRPPRGRRRRGRTAHRGALDTSASIAASSGSTRTPPGAASIRTSRPPTTRCSPPSCQRFATSGPNARNRSVETSKSYGCGIARSGTASSWRRDRGRRWAAEILTTPETAAIVATLL